MTLTDALRGPSEGTSPPDGHRWDGVRGERQIGRGDSVGPSQIGMVGARVSRAPWLWSGPRKAVYAVSFDGGASVDRQGSEAGRAMSSAPIARTLPSGVVKAGNSGGGVSPTDTGKRLVYVSI